MVGSRVHHVGLLARAQRLAYDAEASVHEMAPPLRVGESVDATMRVHAVAWWDRPRRLMGQDREFEEAVEDCLADLRTQFVLGGADYHLGPGGVVERRSSRGRRLGLQFSCSSFVTYVYAKAGRQLVDASALPASDAQLLGNWSRGLGSPGLRARVGLTGSGPWPVLLPGHVLRALEVSAPGCPYAPQPGDVCFPACGG